jgi:hypothetical protein
MFEPLENLLDEADARYQEGGAAVARGRDAQERRKYVLFMFDVMADT